MSEQKSSKVLTTGFGIPVGDDQNSLTAGERGPVLMQDIHLLDKLSHFDRERIPERPERGYMLKVQEPVGTLK